MNLITKIKFKESKYSKKINKKIYIFNLKI